MDDEPDLLGETNVAEPAEVKRKETKAQLLKREDDRFFREEILGCEPGRRFLWSILMKARAFDSPFASSSNGAADQQASFYVSGMKDVGLALYQTWLMVDPQAVAAMHAENDHRFAKRK